MFSDRDSKNNEKIETLIGEQCNIIGNLAGGGLLKIDGSVDGDILWQDTVILGQAASYKGNLTCKNAFLGGKIRGNIICDGCLTIESTGKISGDITIKALIVKDGAFLDGKCTMIVEKDAAELLGD